MTKQDRFKVRCYVTENEGYPEKIGYVNTEDFYIHPEGEVCFFNADYDFAECVIEQCTGLKDKNGKLIYEGDIVRTSYPYAVKNYEVKWGDCCWELRKEKGFIVLYEKISEVLEVIGNIHENPDLLENKDE